MTTHDQAVMPKTSAKTRENPLQSMRTRTNDSPLIDIAKHKIALPSTVGRQRSKGPRALSTLQASLDATL